MEQGWGDSYICKLSSFKIKAIIATECQMFLVEQKAIHLYKETLTKIKEKSLWTALLEWVHLSSILRTYSRVLPFCIIKIPFLSWLHWGIKDSWQSCDMPVLQFSATVLFFLLPVWKLPVDSYCYFIEWTQTTCAWKVLLVSGKVIFL